MNVGPTRQKDARHAPSALDQRQTIAESHAGYSSVAGPRCSSAEV